jgi:hypothetical protein
MKIRVAKKATPKKYFKKGSPKTSGNDFVVLKDGK